MAVTACTQAPLATKTGVAMESAVTARDWGAVAQRITGELRQRGMIVPPQAGVAPGTAPWGPYFVHVTTPGSAFLQAVSDALKADIIASGGTVARVPDGATVINLRVDFVRHGPREQIPGGLGTLVGTTAGLATLAASPGAGAATLGSWGAAGVTAGAGLVSGMLIDQFLLNNSTMAGEAIWSASISTPQQVLMQVGAPVYISSTDIPFYTGDARLAELTTPGVSTRLETKRMRYSGGGGGMPAAASAAPATPCRC